MVKPLKNFRNHAPVQGKGYESAVPMPCWGTCCKGEA